MRAAEICQPRNHHTRVADRSLKRREMNTRIAGRVMRKGRQRLAIGLRDILSPDSAIRTRQTPPWSQRATLAWPEFQVPVVTRFEQNCRVCSRKVGPVLEAGSHR